MIPALLTTCLFACSAFSGGRISRLLGGLHASVYRTTLALGLLALVLFWNRSDFAFTSAASLLLVVSGFIGFGIGDLALYHAYNRIGARLAVLLCQCVAVPIALAAEWLWIGTAVQALDLLWILAILGGVILALAPRENPGLPLRHLLIGTGLGLVSAFGQGFGAVLSRRAYEAQTSVGLDIDVPAVTFLRLASGWVFLLLWLTFHMGRQPFPSRYTVRKSFPWLFANALAGPCLGVMMYQYALSVAPSGPVLAIVATTPIAVIPLTAWIDGDCITPKALAGSVLAIAGVIGLLVIS